ncbi:MAG: FAD-binding oxidoreductase [Paracoccaceae bacterium]|nr:FAD-binding oxidoreductase [Paracoccaceae bacterium]MDE2917776.1 FAD-binding oxidoreductase [Paracoccaceae bacterium]
MAELIKEPFWWESAGRPQPVEEIDLPEEVDVVVVGAGLTGLTAALFLAKGNKKVLVLDKITPCLGASSRNGGMIGGGHRVSVDLLIQKYGRDLASHLLQEMHIDSTVFAKNLMTSENIDCDFQETGRFQAFWKKSDYESFASKLDQLRELIPVEADLVSPADQKNEVASKAYHGGISYHLHGGINPAKWVYGIKNRALEQGVIIQGDTPVEELHYNAGVHTVKTPRGSVKAQDVLMATNGYTPSNFGDLSKRIFPIPSFIIVTETLGENRVRDLFPGLKMIVETRERHCYFRPSPDRKRIVFGGRAAMFKPPDNFFESQLRMLLAGIFPDLKNVGITHAWWGNTGFTFEMLPHVGKLNNVWHAMGYCGNGNGMAPWLGYKVANRILGNTEGETAFAEIEMPTKWYYNGVPWFLPFADVGFRFRDLYSNIQK